MTSLDQKLEEIFNALQITNIPQKTIQNYLGILKAKDDATYYHSVRVGILCVQIAQYLNYEQKTLLYAGLLHDVGKMLIDPALLSKKDGFSIEEMDQMKKHTEYSYHLLKGVHNFSAEIVLRHHRFQENSYPDNLPQLNQKYSDEAQQKIDEYARILSLADFYDAITTRNNDKHSNKNLTPTNIKEIIITKNSDQIKLIEELYEQGIF